MTAPKPDATRKVRTARERAVDTLDAELRKLTTLDERIARVKPTIDKAIEDRATLATRVRFLASDPVLTTDDVDRVHTLHPDLFDDERVLDGDGDDPEELDLTTAPDPEPATSGGPSVTGDDA